MIAEQRQLSFFLFMSLNIPVGEETTTLQAGKPSGIRSRTSH